MTVERVALTLNIMSADQAITDSPTTETCRMLGEVIKKLQSGRNSGVIVDVNGNRAGDFLFTIHKNKE